VVVEQAQVEEELLPAVMELPVEEIHHLVVALVLEEVPAMELQPVAVMALAQAL